MGKNTDQKLKKIADDQQIKKITEAFNKRHQPVAKKKVPTIKVVTEESESKRSTIFLIVAFLMLGGLGVYFKFFYEKTPDYVEPKSITGLFGERENPDDKMLKPHKITEEEIFNYSWNDNPVYLAQIFEIISITERPNKNTRIRIHMPEYEGKRIPLRKAGDFLTPEYKIIDIQAPVIFLSDENGKLNRLVERNSWNIAAEIFKWKKDLFKSFEEAMANKNLLPQHDARLVFGEYVLINPDDYQITKLREWCNAHAGYSFEEFDNQCKELEIRYELDRPTAYGGVR